MPSRPRLRPGQGQELGHSSDSLTPALRRFCKYQTDEWSVTERSICDDRDAAWDPPVRALCTDRAACDRRGGRDELRPAQERGAVPGPRRAALSRPGPVVACTTFRPDKG